MWRAEAAEVAEVAGMLLVNLVELVGPVAQAAMLRLVEPVSLTRAMAEAAGEEEEVLLPVVEGQSSGVIVAVPVEAAAHRLER